MANSDSTLGHHLPERNFSDKIHKPSPPDHLMINNNAGNDSSDLSVSFSLLDDSLAEQMETLRQHINNALRLPLPVQKRSRLVSAHVCIGMGELEFLVEEVRLLAGFDQQFTSP